MIFCKINEMATNLEVDLRVNFVFKSRDEMAPKLQMNPHLRKHLDPLWYVKW